MLHKQELNLAQQGISIKSRASKFSSVKDKSITHDLATASRRKKAVLTKLIQGDPKQPIYFIMYQFCTSKLENVISSK